MRLIMHLRDRHLYKSIDFKGTVADLAEILEKRYGIKDNILSEDYSVLVDGVLAKPETNVGETVAIILAI